MDIEGRRRSTNFEDRGAGERSPLGGGGGGLPVNLISSLVERLGIKGTLVVAVLLGGAYLVMPNTVGQLLGVQGGSSGAKSKAGESVCKASTTNGKACDFSLTILASTEDVWKEKFQQSGLPNYGTPASAYQEPTLVVFSGSVQTGGCGGATSDVGPFYCSGDRKLYIDPSFYQLMEQRLKAPGDFAQAYVVAHEVGHHVQNLIGSSRLKVRGETRNQVSVRVELQADCFAGVWGHTAKAALAINEEDLKEALTAAHQIGDDTLGHSDKAEFTHGSSAQRMKWFRRGFDTGDARQCDTFAVTDPAGL